MIQLIPVTKSVESNSGLKNLYESAFPPDERRDWNQFAELLYDRRFELYLITHQQKMIGFISVWDLIDLTFIEHFAILESERGKGFGSQTINQIISAKNTTIILEVELPVTETAGKRIRFYEWLNFKVCNSDYFQPPYSSEKEKVKMLLMSYPDKISNTDFSEIIQLIYRKVYQFQE
jgi:GNAT superfamily N-acetyltransferase